MSYILNLETATEVCSVCISYKTEVIAFSEAEKPFNHAASITLLIEKCMHEASVSFAQLDAIAVSAGPGSYTSLRVGASTAKGICYAMNIPLISVDTLKSIALASKTEANKELLYCSMIDARRMEVYCAVFDHNFNQIRNTEAVIISEDSFHDLFAKKATIVFSGNGSKKCREMIKSPLAIFSETVCSAKNLPPISWPSFQLKCFEDVAAFSPNYQKSPNVTISKKNPFKNDSK
jgi:tRNA threonylcarbamoyladenosine biosynthesis protein TsaB